MLVTEQNGGADHFAEVVKERSERMMLTLLCDVLGPAAVTVLDVTGETRVWQVDESSGEFVQTVASAEMQQRRTVV